MGTVDQLETKLNELFTTNTPKLPEGGRKTLVQYAPIISLVVGVLSLVNALSLWRWAHAVNTLTTGFEQLCKSYSSSAYAYNCDANLSAHRLSAWIWLTLLLMLTEAVLYLMAYPGLHDHRKQGWNYIYYASLLSLLFSVISLFNGYGGVSGFVLGLLGAAIGFYLLFQIRSAYTPAKATVRTHDDPAPNRSTKDKE